jgi:gas vesicle protein
MTNEEPSPELTEPAMVQESTEHDRAGFLAGVLFGAFLGAGVALLFAPEKGQKTRRELDRRLRALRHDALDVAGRAGSRAKKQLRRRELRLKLELDRARERNRRED